MGATIENVRGTAAHEPAFVRELGEPNIAEFPRHALDSPENVRLHGRLLDWYYAAQDAMFDNRFEQQLDYDFYDHVQWSDADAAVLAARHQAPLTYNKIKIALDWIIGTERRTRIDGVVHPRTEDDVKIAPIKTELLKYLSDSNRVPWERSKAFKDQAIVGIGWTEETVRADRREDPVQVNHIPWQQMLWDYHSRKDDLSDARYVIRHKYVDKEYADAMFPGRTEVIERSASDHFALDGLEENEVDVPQLWRRYDSRGHEMQGRKFGGRQQVEMRGGRLRVHLIECWFRKPVTHQNIWGAGFSGERFDGENERHAEAKQSIDRGESVYSLSDAVTEEIWCAIFTEDGLLKLSKSPFNHGQFPFTPYWCYRRSRDGLPYGVVRGVRDAQEDLNKRFSKLLWALSTNQLFYEDGAIDPDRLEEVKREIAKPNGVIPLQDGGLTKIKVERNLDVAEAQIRMIELDEAHIHDGSGVNREQLGRDTNAASGRAILAKQQEGAVTTAELFDSYRLGIQLSGEKQLSLVEQYMTEERQFRIVGERKGLDWQAVNRLAYLEDEGTWDVENDITKNHADFIVDQQDFRESMRQAYAEQFFEMLGKLDPNMAINLLDLAFEMTDVPGKDEIVRRIRKVNGQSDTEGDEESPEVIAKRQADTEAAELAMRERMAKVGLDEAKAGEIVARTRSLKLGDKQTAMQLAELIEALMPLAPAADRLLSDTLPTQLPPPSSQQEVTYAQ